MTTKKTKNQCFDTSIDPNFFKNKNEPFYIIHRRMRTMNDIEVLDSKRVRELLKISEGTLHALIKGKDIPHFFIGKKVLRFNKKSIMDWLQNLEDNNRRVS
jgi:predicted DNA-binding transcriptional regulator AlpA